jgi:beta-1,4-mannosyltransferase
MQLTTVCAMASTAGRAVSTLDSPRVAELTRPTRVASFPPPIRQNPYQRLLYEHLSAHGVKLVGNARLSLGWLVRARSTVDVLHFHWPQGYYRHDAGPRRLRPYLSWLRLGLFRARLAAARRLGYRVVWTVHQIVPHESSSARLDRAGAKALAAASDVLLVHDEATAARARRELDPSGSRIDVVPHGSYLGVYPKGRPRDVVRAELVIPRDGFVFLSFGHIRGYKDLDVLLSAFRSASLPNAVLVVAGLVIAGGLGEAIQEAAAADPRIRPVLDFVPDERVGELFGACDAAVLPRGDGGTSGALVLALSLGLPVVAAATPTYAELTDSGRAGWLFEPRDPAALARALEAAAADPESARVKGELAAEVAARLDWDDAARRSSALMKGELHA